MGNVIGAVIVAIMAAITIAGVYRKGYEHGFDRASQLYTDLLRKRVGIIMPDDPFEVAIRTSIKCCACAGSLESSFLNLVMLDYEAAWDHPTAGNVLTGEFGHAVAVLCDECIDGDAEILFAVEWPGKGRGDFKVTYHPITSLKRREERRNL